MQHDEAGNNEENVNPGLPRHRPSDRRRPFRADATQRSCFERDVMDRHRHRRRGAQGLKFRETPRREKKGGRGQRGFAMAAKYAILLTRGKGRPIVLSGLSHLTEYGACEFV